MRDYMPDPEWITYKERQILMGNDVEAEPLVNDLAFKVNTVIEVNKAYEQLIGELLATLSMSRNQDYKISELQGYLVPVKLKYNRLLIGIT